MLVASDYFNKWVEAYAIPNQEVITVARKLCFVVSFFQKNYTQTRAPNSKYFLCYYK